ncbi:E3 ubiquitin-protein ligase rnf213-alpha-like isoform X3 [Falco biarmicus]|uniref:E3 ubiquitin-protein ligase rnf213-alpha-like isoform X3 n=1 Tax=Falco biarmicus TaxID=345155 RepID=UPI0024BC1C79|nr:E3 ubiquitin-protein ligase rnf213-alpha-like isoform X3 [Falco biarmicus]
MEGVEGDREGENKENPYPVPPSTEEGSSDLLHDKEGMKSAELKNNKQQPLGTDHLTATMLAPQESCDTTSSLGLVRSEPSTEYDSKSWKILPTNSAPTAAEEEKLQVHTASAELLRDHHSQQKSFSQSTDDTSVRANENEIVDHQRREELVEQENCNRRDEHESKENLGPKSRTGGNYAEDTPLPRAAARGWEKCICLENPYLSNERLRTEETMTLEFVAVMSKKSRFSENSSKICVAFYKQPGQYQEIALLKKRKNLIVGQAIIPISDLQKGPIFYKYAILNQVHSTDHEMRLCDLEHIYEMDSNNIESQLHRVINIPKEEIKADGTWTIFENIKCYFHEEKKSCFKYLSSFKLWSSNTLPQKSVNFSIIEYLADEFLWPIRLQNNFKTIERKLKIYTETFKIYLGDAVKGKPYFPTDLTEQVLHDNMIKFMDKILELLETEEHKDDGLLFALHTSFHYKIPLSKEVIIKIEKLFQGIGPFQGKFKYLKGKSKYVSSVKGICLSNKNDTLWIWLIPLLYAITEKTEDTFFSQTIPLQHLLQLRNDEEKQRKVMAMIEIHKSFIENCFPLAKTVLEMLALKKFTKDSLLQIKVPPQLFLDTVYQRIVNIVSKPSQVHEKDLNGVVDNIAERMAFWFKDLCLPQGSKQLMKPTHEEDILPCLNSTYALLLFSLKHSYAMPITLIMSLLRILDMFAEKSDVLQENQEFQQFILERFNEYAGYIKEWLGKSLFRPLMGNKQLLETVNVCHELFSFKILCVEWTQKWQSLIYSMVESWLEKVDNRKRLDLYLEFMKKDKCWNTNLESCFTDCVIQSIKHFMKSEEPILGKLASEVLKRDRSTARKVLSAVAEKIFSDKMSMLENVSFVDTREAVLTETLSSPVTCDVLYAVKKSEHKLQSQISEKVKILLSQFSDFFYNLKHQVFSGDISCNVLSIILQHQEQFQNILCICDSSVSSCIATVLEVRREEYAQLEEQKQQRLSFLHLCNSIGDVIRVDRRAVKKSIRKRGCFKDQMSVSRFSNNGKKKAPELHFLSKYSDMMKKIHILKESNYFQRLWKQKAEEIKARIPEEKILLIEDVQENIYKPAAADFQSTYLALKDFSITLGNLQSHFEKQLTNESQLTKEFRIMEMSEGKGSGKAAWVDAAVEKIKTYLTLSTVVSTAKMIDELRKTLKFNGNFQILDDLTKYEEVEFRNKTLDCMTQDLMNVKNSLSNLPEAVLDFLRELLECTRKGFVSLIKTIIKDKTEIPAFVELASIYAGENDIDIDKVQFFRDAVTASAPIIFDLGPTSGFEHFSAALSFISEATAKDHNLPKKLKDSCDNREWIQMVHDSYGSIERSSISQARDINNRGIFIISAPQKFKATLEDCVSLRLLKDATEEASQTDQKAKGYSLAQLIELQNKLMLVTTKAEQGREEANRFLEILEKVQMVAKLYLHLLRAGNILFIDWKADIYCNPQHKVQVYTEFRITGTLVQSTRPVLEELDGLCKAMEYCLVEWKKYLETQRDTYYHLNLFTSPQLFYLCGQLAKAHNSVIEPQVLNMLSVVKRDIEAEDIRKALEQALMTPLDSVNTSAGEISVTWHNYVVRFPQLINSLAESGYDAAVAKAALQSCLSDSDVTEQNLMSFAFQQGDDKELVENLSKLYDEQREAFLQKSRKFKNRNIDVNKESFNTLAEGELITFFESLQFICDKVCLLWKAYWEKYPELVSDKYISLDVFGETLKQLAALETTCIKRSLPVGLEARKPSLIMCKEEEMLLYMLSVYRHTETAPVPTYDEVLVCTPDTEEEEVELIVRRALSSDSQNQKIYCLLGAEKLAYKVSKQLETHFFSLLQSSTVPEYRFIIFCDAKAHNSYVITAFNTYKVTIPCYSKTEIQTYLSTHLKVPCGTAPMAQAFEEPYQQNVKFIISDQAGMGKSHFVNNTLQKIHAQLCDLPVVHKTIRLLESEIDFQFLLKELLSVEEIPTETRPIVFHIDVSPVVSRGLYRLLIELCILRHIQSPNGLVWKCKSSHLYLIEYLAKGRGVIRTREQEVSNETEEKFLDLFPTVKCVSPMQVLDLLEHPSSRCLSEMKEEYFDRDMLKSEAFQRSYQYLRRYKREENLDSFLFIPERTEGTEKECLKILLEFCGRHNPSWTELSNFTHFLNFQLRKCEKSVFCSPAVGKDFQGFKTFVVKFMITMSKDFAVPSLDISDESVSSVGNDDEENSIMRQYQLRRKWEQECHPYIFFHADNHSMEFLGFHINNNLDAIDAHSQAVLESNVIKGNLYHTLKAQNVPFNKKFEDLPRTMQLETLCRVFGVSCTQDPDESYQLTLDNTMKMLAIHLRFQCGIPVIIMGETGCGKTKLVQFMCNLQRAGRDMQNMVVVRVHGGTTSKTIHKKVRKAIELALINEERHKVDTVLFFDEANTSEAIFAIKEVLCDHSVNGEVITDCLKVVAACNPYKRHTKETIEKLEKAGLGYRVRSEDTLEKLGSIPLRQLVYRVKPLPPSLLPLVWDFGELNENTRNLYIREIVKSTMKTKIAFGNLDIFTSVISASQKFLRKNKDDCRIASLRDIERCMNIALWFYNLRDLLFPKIDEKKYEKKQKPILNDAERALVLSVGACYYVSLENRKDYLEEVAKCFSVPASQLQQEIELCQEVFLDNLSIPEATARNDALRENIFMTVLCMDLRVPLFLVGKPGSSKSLSKTIAVDAMQGRLSKSQLFKRFKEIQLVSFQCSPHSKPEGIISTFRQCAQFQKGKNLDEFASVVLLNEIGLAEDSTEMPLKTLHPLLEDGSVDDENPEAYQKVGFVGISNWALDPAKMNRGLLVFRTDPSKEELVKTAKGICSAWPHLESIENLFPSLAEFYCKVLKTQKNEFFGLRDFYSLIKMILSYTQDKKCIPQEEIIIKAIQRNFGGSDFINPVELFRNCISEVYLPPDLETSHTLHLLKENMGKQQAGLMSRYLLLLTTNRAAFHIIQMTQLIDTENCEIIFGSGFPQDQDYSQVCRSVSRLKICMEIGRPVILLNIHNLYESLYDALNQCFVTLGGNYYVDLGLGTHRVKSRVKDEFRLIVIEEKNVVYAQFPTPLLNRLEKHYLDMNTILNWQQQQLKQDLQTWTKLFVSMDSSKFTNVLSAKPSPKEQDVFIGFSNDTTATVALESTQGRSCGVLEPYEESALSIAKRKLVQCATPDSILRLKYSLLDDAEKIQDLYFKEQKHNSLANVLEEAVKWHPRKETTAGLCLQVSTHARLLNERDLEKIRKALKLQNKIYCLFLSQFDTEYSFRKELSNFFAQSSEGKFLLIQFHFDEPQSSQRLLACAKYCIIDERRKSTGTGPSHVVLATQVPRVLGGCSYLAFDSGEWMSIHLDDLMPSDNFTANPGDLAKMTVAKIFNNACQGHSLTGPPEESAALEDPAKSSLSTEGNFLSMDSMIKESIQKAVIQLEDKTDNSRRAIKRITIIYNLLFQDHGRTTLSSCFMNVLKKRICHLLEEREKISFEPGEWVFRRAVSSEFILEETSFRHALWMHLEDIVANLFAQILAVVDANNNLDHLFPLSPFSELWLQMFAEDSFLSFKYTSKKQDAKISVLSMTEDPNTSMFCQFPFSWVLKAYLEELWEKVYNTRGHPKIPMKEPAEFFQSLVKDVLMPDGSNPEMMQCYTNDFLRMTFPGQDHSVYEILSKALLVNAKQLCSSVGQRKISFSPIWLHMEYFYLREEYQLFVDLVKIDETVTSDLQKKYEKDPPEMFQFITLDTLNILLKKVQPTGNLRSFEACTEWLRRVKSIMPWMEQISIDNYQLNLHQKKRELLRSVLHEWTCTNIVYMFFDHMLHNETEIDEKLLRLLGNHFIFIWNRLTKTQNFEPAETLNLVTEVLKKCNEKAEIVYLVKGVKDCKSCLLEITDPAELPCGHIFCSQCIREWSSKHCKICKANFPEDYTPTATVATREAVASRNKFRRKCNSFFVEFVTTSILGDRGIPSPEVITQLIQFVACKPSSPEHQAVKRVCKSKSELSPFEECIDTSPTVKSSLLKLLLRHGFNNIKVHLEKYLSEMEKKITFNKINWNHFYFMVVHCLEDCMYPSSQDDASQLAERCLSTADLSAFCSCRLSKIDTLQFIARLRFSISHVATVLGRQVLCDPNRSPGGNKQEEQDLVNAMKKLVVNAQTPWPQIFLIKNLHNNYGFMPMQEILQAEKWILPRGVEISQHMSTWSNITLMLSVLDRAKSQINNKDPQEVQRLVPVIKQMENILQTPMLPEETLEKKMKKIMDALCRHKNNVLMEVVFHTAFTLALSQSPLTQLFRNICFKPHVVKGSYLPTMPEDLLFDQKNWKIGQYDTPWVCQCGSYWIITNCGNPVEVKQCLCGAKIGGINHIPERGFVRKEITEDKTGKGYILGSPSIRRIELERDLSPASVCLARALLHCSMLLGIYTDKQAILSLMTEKPKDVAKFFWDHLEKDIECLAVALSRNMEDATVTVHLFLQHLSNSTTVKGQNMAFDILLRQEDRRKWETCFKTLTQPFFQAWEQSLTSVKQQRIRDPQGSSLLLQIAYGEIPPFEDQPNLGLIGLSYMWRFEQKMSIQTLMHLLQQEQQEGKGNCYPVLLELMSKLQNIQYVQHLPDIFSLQKALIHFFQNSHAGETYSVQQFLELSEDQRSTFCRAIGTIQKVWSNIRMKPLCSDVRVPLDLLPKDINASTAVLKLLPTPLSVGHLVTSLLIQLQNSCVDTATQITKEKQRTISAEEVKPSSVLKITENDLIIATLANSQYVIDENGTKTTHFDFQALQRQVIQRFISGKPIIKAQTAPSFALNSMKTLQHTKMKVREQLAQESLSVNQLKQIMEEARSVNAISQTLATLKVAAEFLAVTGEDPKRQLSEYVKNELKMDAGVEQFRDMPVVLNTQLKHILSLWQTLSAKRSVLLVQMNQNPFCLVPEQYHEELSAEMEKALTTALSTVNLDLFLIELHEMIAVSLDSFNPQWELKETFRLFLEDRQDDDSIANLTGTLSPNLLLKDVVSVWKTAVRTSKLHSSIYIQE